MVTSSVDLHSLDDTRALARKVLQMAPAGTLLLLVGPLGAGKTTFTQFLGQALLSDAQTSSPTYTLIHEYPTPEGALVHVDAYRLPSAEALFGLGLEDYLDRARLVVVEWGEALLESYPEALVVRLELDDGARRAHLERGGAPLE